MNWQYTPYIIPLIIATIILGALVLYAWRRHTVSGATAFALLMLVIAEWSLGYALELGSANLASKIFWGKVEYLGIASMPVAWLAFALAYTHWDNWLTYRRLIALAIVPFMTIILIWTNEAHGLIWFQTGLNVDGPFPALEIRYGRWFWIHTVYSYTLITWGTILLIRMLIRSSPQLYRLQTSAILIGTVIPWIGNGIYVFGLSPIPHLDLTPFAFTISGLVMAWSLFRFRLLDIVPIARRAVVDSMRDGVIVLDTQNRVVDLNPAAQIIIGIVDSEAIGQPVSTILAGQADLIERYQDMSLRHIEITLGRDENQKHYELQISTLLDQRSYTAGRLIVLHDITNRKATEEALALARDQALEASHWKTELLAKVSHELRTPLSAILGYAELIELGIYGPLNDKQADVITKIIRSTQEQTSLVNELLDQAQLDASRLKLNITSFTVSDIIEGMLSKLGFQAKAKGIALITDIADDMPTTLSGDPVRLQQILLNLAGNAIKFSEQGEIRVRLFCPSKTHWAMQVSDNGPGIPAEAHSHIFEPFRQIDGSVTRKFNGAGLGLSIVKQLTNLMGGQITLESEVGQGSTFTVTLPLTPIQFD